MNLKELETKEKITWCPGCPNFAILKSTKDAIFELIQEKKIKKENMVIATGIGCSPKIYDYLNLNAFYALHGRELAVMQGIKSVNSDLTVMGFAGDGNVYAEGVCHFVHNARFNADIKLFVHNNQVFALTTGQATPVTETGFVDGSSPYGVKERPLNPILLALSSGATFVARAYALDMPHLKEIMKMAILHKGFAFVDILQPCVSFHDNTVFFQKHVYKMGQGHDLSDLGKALEMAREWDYCQKEEDKIPLGIFYQIQKPTFQDNFEVKTPLYKMERKINWKETLKEFK